MTEGRGFERRRHRRFDGSDYPLRIGRYRARLIDWSAGGLGVVVKEPIDGFALGQTVELGILNELIFAARGYAGRLGAGATELIGHAKAYPRREEARLDAAAAVTASRKP